MTIENWSGKKIVKQVSIKWFRCKCEQIPIQTILQRWVFICLIDAGICTVMIQFLNKENNNGLCKLAAVTHTRTSRDIYSYVCMAQWQFDFWLIRPWVINSWLFGKIVRRTNTWREIGVTDGCVEWNILRLHWDYVIFASCVFVNSWDDAYAWWNTQTYTQFEWYRVLLMTKCRAFFSSAD